MNFLFCIPDELRAESVGCFLTEQTEATLLHPDHIYYPKGPLLE